MLLPYKLSIQSDLLDASNFTRICYLHYIQSSFPSTIHAPTFQIYNTCCMRQHLSVELGFHWWNTFYFSTSYFRHGRGNTDDCTLLWQHWHGARRANGNRYSSSPSRKWWILHTRCCVRQHGMLHAYSYKTTSEAGKVQRSYIMDLSY